MFTLYILGATVLFVACLAVRAHLKHETLRQETSRLVFKLTLEGSAMEKDVLGKVYALENGGHLAAGTTQMLVNAQTTPDVAPNGSPAPVLAQTL